MQYLLAHLKLIQRLKKARSPLLFGAGPLDNLDRGGICIVGSRDSPKTALSFSANLGDRCANEGLTVISSDMRGVDREAVTSALEKSGRVIVVLSDRRLGVVHYVGQVHFSPGNQL